VTSARAADSLRLLLSVSLSIAGTCKDCCSRHHMNLSANISWLVLRLPSASKLILLSGAFWSMKWGPGQLLILGPMAHAAQTESRRKGPKGARNVSGALEISRDNTMARTPLPANRRQDESSDTAYFFENETIHAQQLELNAFCSSAYFMGLCICLPV
jgi:hypothetical protein